jgi:hypothetical protein
MVVSLPDYKLPISFFSDRALLHDVDLSALLTVRKDPQLSNTLAFSLEKARRPIFRNGLAADLANSFLVACSDAALPEHDVLAVHYGDVRRPQFKKEVRFEWSGDAVTVRRSRLHPVRPQSQTDVISLHLKDEEFLGGRTGMPTSSFFYRRKAGRWSSGLHGLACGSMHF